MILYRDMNVLLDFTEFIPALPSLLAFNEVSAFIFAISYLCPRLLTWQSKQRPETDVFH
jgi:hypothetical protein